MSKEFDTHQEVFHGQTVTILDKGELIISVEKAKEMVNKSEAKSTMELDIIYNEDCIE